MPTRNISYRLGTTGKAEVKNDFAEIAQAGEAQAKRLTATYEAQAQAAERAAERAARTASKIAAIAPQTALQMQIASASGTNLNYQSAGGLRGDFEGSAKRSALAFRELIAEQERMEARGRSIRAMLDPLYAAQERYNSALAEARTLAAAKILTDEQLIQREGQLKAALDAETAAAQRNNVSLGQRRAAFQQLGFQANDIAQGLAMGTAPLTIFAQQAGQTGQAVQLLAGEGKGFAAFLSGPWGAATIAGVTVLAAFIPKLFETRDAIKAATQELEKQSRAEEVASAAARAFASTQQGVHDALLKAEESRKRATADLLSHAEATNIAAKQNLDFIDTNLRVAQSLLMIRTANLQRAQGMNLGSIGASAGPGQAAYDEVKAIESRVIALMGDRGKAAAELEASRAELAAEAARRAVDPVGRLNRQFDDEVRAAQAAARANHTVNETLTAQILLIEQRRRAAVKAAQEDARETKPHFGRDIAEGNRADLLAAAQRYAGLSEHKAGDKSTLRDLFRQAGSYADVDPEMVKWCAAFVNAVLATQGLKGSGSLGARSFLGWGKSTDSPTAGDIVVSSSKGQDHVGFFQGFDAKGNVRLFSGNTSDQVGSSTINKNDVLGFRRAPTAGQAFDDAREQAEKAALAVAKLREEVLRIEDGFDPAAAAARRLAEQIAKISEAEGAGVISAGQSMVDRLKAANPDFADPKASLSRFMASTLRLDETTRAWGEESDQRAKAYEDSTNRAAQVVIDNFEEMKRAGEGFIDTVLNPQNWRSWSSLGKSILRELEADFIRLAAINPLKNLLFGDKLPTLAGGIARLFGSPAPVGQNAAGTEYWAGGMTVVGEFGPELASLPTGTRIRSAAQTRQLIGGGGGQVVNQYVDMRGAIVDRDLWAQVDQIAKFRAGEAGMRAAVGGSEMAIAELRHRGRQSLAGL